MDDGKKQVGDYGVHMGKFCAEWLARFAPQSDTSVSRYVTVKDCAMALAFVGDFSTRFVDMEDQPDEFARIVNRFPDANEHLKPGGFHPTAISYGDLMAALSVDTARDIERITYRCASMLSRGEHLFFRMNHYDKDGYVSTRLLPHLLKAHPLNSVAKKGVDIDLFRLATMSTVQSVPIALRAIVWVYANLDTGIERLVAEDDRSLDKKSRQAVTIDVPIDKVREVFGLAQTRVWKAHLLRVDEIVADLAHMGIKANMEWLYRGRSPVVLRAKFERTKRASSVWYVRGQSKEMAISHATRRLDRKMLVEAGVRPRGPLQRRFPKTP